MAQWQRKLDLSDVWKKAQNNEITTLELAKELVNRLQKLKKFNNWVDDETESIIECFVDFIDCAEDNKDEFDYCMNELYDWGDMKLDENWNGKKVCWINTIM